METKYYQGSEFIGQELRKSSIEIEYVILAKTSTSVDLTFNAILEWIHAVLGSLVRTYNIKETYKDEN